MESRCCYLLRSIERHPFVLFRPLSVSAANFEATLAPPSFSVWQFRHPTVATKSMPRAALPASWLLTELRFLRLHQIICHGARQLHHRANSFRAFFRSRRTPTDCSNNFPMPTPAIWIPLPSARRHAHRDTPHIQSCRTTPFPIRLASQRPTGQGTSTRFKYAATSARSLSLCRRDGMVAVVRKWRGFSSHPGKSIPFSAAFPHPINPAPLACDKSRSAFDGTPRS